MYRKLDKLRDYIVDNEFRITFFENRTHVMNYLELLSLGSDRIALKTAHLSITLWGEDLVLSKMLEQEIMILGRITKVEMTYDK